MIGISPVQVTAANYVRAETDILSLGVNWWFTWSAHLSVNYRYITLDRFGTPEDRSGLNARILLMLDRGIIST